MKMVKLKGIPQNHQLAFKGRKRNATFKPGVYDSKAAKAVSKINPKSNIKLLKESEKSEVMGVGSA